MKCLKNITQEKHKGCLKKVEKFNKIINDNPDMTSEQSEMINRLIELYCLKRLYYLNNAANNSKANEKNR